MLLSHKKYQEIVTGFADHIPDEELMDRLLQVIKTVFNYSEEQKTYKPQYYEKVKEKRRAGDQSWNEYQRRYHEVNKERLNERRRARYQEQKSTST